MAGVGMPSELREALGSLSSLLSFEKKKSPPQWLLGGSCGLLLQGVPLKAAPHDIDLYADLSDSEALHRALSRWALDTPEEDWSRGCFSLMSHYRLGVYPVDLICGFKICGGYSQYVVETKLLLNDAPAQNFEGIGRLCLMPLAHEFVFNVLRGRRDRIEGIAAIMSNEMDKHLPLLQTLIKRNGLDGSHVLQLQELLGGAVLQV